MHHTIHTDRYAAKPLRAILTKHGATFREVTRWWFLVDLIVEAPSPQVLSALAAHFDEVESAQAW